MTHLKEDVPNQTWRKGCFGVAWRLTVLAELSITTIRFNKDYLLKEAEAYRTLCSVSHYLTVDCSDRRYQFVPVQELRL